MTTSNIFKHNNLLQNLSTSLTLKYALFTKDFFLKQTTLLFKINRSHVTPTKFIMDLCNYVKIIIICTSVVIYNLKIL